MVRHSTFLAIIDGTPKWHESWCIDRFDALAQMREIYSASFIDVVLFQFKD